MTEVHPVMKREAEGHLPDWLLYSFIYNNFTINIDIKSNEVYKQ